MQKEVEMKHLHNTLFFFLVLAACQAQPALPSPVPPAGTIPIAPSKPASVTKVSTASVSLTAISPPTQSAVNSSNSNPNAGNLVVVRDQPIINNSLTIDTIMAAQAGWIVLYSDKSGSPGHYICYLPVPAGKSVQFKILLDQSSNIIVDPATLHGRQIDIVLQAGAKAPGKPVSENGKMAMARFTISPK